MSKLVEKYARYVKSMARKASRMARIEYDDMVQELMLKLIEVDDGALSEAYIITALYNHVKSMARKRRLPQVPVDVEIAAKKSDDYTALMQYVQQCGTEVEFSILSALVRKEHRTHGQVMRALRVARRTYYKYFRLLQCTVREFYSTQKMVYKLAGSCVIH